MWIGWKPHDDAQGAPPGDGLTVRCVNDKPDGSYQSTARELADQLGLDGALVAINSRTRSVGEAIFDFAKSVNATCLLIGAFKHGYLLELLLGRITHYLLSHSPHPFMMKH